jgi:aminoglycoside 6'-N-acetyltransferase
MDATPELISHRTRLRAVVPDDTATLRSIVGTPEVARWFHTPDDDFPFDVDDDTVRWVVQLTDASDIGRHGEVIGMVQAYEGSDPDYDECGIDVFLAPSAHGRGLGTEVVTQVRDWLVQERGHHLVQIDPDARNATAIACYERCGFRRVGVLVGRERDTDGPGWHDTLLMAYVAPR